MIRSRLLSASIGFAVLLLAPLATVHAQSGDKVQLAYKYPEDSKSLYAATQSLKGTMSVFGIQQEMDIKNAQYSEVVGKGPNEQGNPAFEIATQRLVFNMNMTSPPPAPSIKYKFDSAKEERDDGIMAQQMNPVYELLAESDFTITVEPTGKILEVDGAEQLLEKLRGMNPQAAGMFKGEEAKKGLAKGSTSITLPKTPVAVGDTWTSELSANLNGLGQMKGQDTCKLTGIETEDGKRIATIEVTTEATVDLSQIGGGAQVEGKITVDSSKGTVRFDIDAGKLISHEGEIVLSGMLTVNAGGQQIPMTMKMTQGFENRLIDKIPQPE